MSNQIQNYIDGKSVESLSKERIIVENPATEQSISEIPNSGVEDVDLAVQAAKQALPSWRQTPAAVRARILFRFRQLLDQHRSDVARAISLEHGKTTEDALAEISRAMDVVEFACGIPHLLKGERSSQAADGISCWSEMKPVGVCAGITPFNFPAMVPLWMFPIAIASGNTFILKPSEKDPSAPSLFPELLKEAGLPAGVFNLVHGSARTVDAILNHDDIDAVSFVGSTAVAEHVYSVGSARGKRVQALGGAKNHAVVMPDADLELAAEQLTGSAYGSAGERCMAISVVVVVGDDTADALVSKLIRPCPETENGSIRQ